MILRSVAPVLLACLCSAQYYPTIRKLYGPREPSFGSYPTYGDQGYGSSKIPSDEGYYPSYGKQDCTPATVTVKRVEKLTSTDTVVKIVPKTRTKTVKEMITKFDTVTSAIEVS